MDLVAAYLGYMQLCYWIQLYTLILNTHANCKTDEKKQVAQQVSQM